MKLAVIGAGTIGAGTAYNVATRGVVDDIVLIDLDEEKAEGEALDIAHATSFDPGTTVRQGTYEDASDADIVAMTAGKPRTEGMSRTDLLAANVEVVKAVYENAFGDDAVFVTTTNPMDAINYASYHVSEHERKRFVGFGGWLDAARFQHVLADYLDLTGGDIAAFVMGEHGDSQVPVYSKTTVDGDPVDVPGEERAELAERMRESAMDVISRKGGTEWAPTYGMAEIIEAIATDAGKLFTCSAVLDGEYGYEDLSIGVPVKLGRDGIVEIVEWDLAEDEREAFEESAARMEELCAAAADML